MPNNKKKKSPHKSTPNKKAAKEAEALSAKLAQEVADKQIVATDEAKAREGKSGRGKDNDDSLADGSDNSSSGGEMQHNTKHNHSPACF